MIRKTLIVTTALIAAGTMTAVAASPSGDDQGRRAGGPPVQATVMFNLLDTNGDGVIDATELDAVTKAIIEAVDEDGDGSLSEAEFTAMAKHFGRGGQRMGRGSRGGQHGMYQGRGGRGGDRSFGRGMIGEDGLTEEAFLERQAERFAALDADGDGTITQEELRAHRGDRGPRSSR